MTDKPRYLLLDFEIAGKCYMYVDSNESLTYWVYYSDYIKYARDKPIHRLLYYTKVANLEPDVKEKVLNVLFENEYKYGYYD